MFKRLYRWILSAVLILAAIVIAVSNPQSVAVNFNPFAPQGSGEQIPLFLVILLSILLGLIIGGFASWWGGGEARKYARAFRAYETAEKRAPKDEDQDLRPVKRA